MIQAGVTELMRVDEIARRLNAGWEGAGEHEIRGAATLEAAGPQDIAFVGNRKAAAQADKSAAGCLLVSSDFAVGRTLIRVADPRASFATAIGLLYPPRAAAPGIHPSAVIAAGAEI